MGKYSNFERVPQDAYQTPDEPIDVLVPHLAGISTFAEPCVGEGRLKARLEKWSFVCSYSADIITGQDARTDEGISEARFDAIITNPPYKAKILLPLVNRWMKIAPTWLLLEVDWSSNYYSGPLMKHCSTIVPVGRVAWFGEGGKTNYAWYRFSAQHTNGAIFVPRAPNPNPRKKREKKIPAVTVSDDQ